MDSKRAPLHVVLGLLFIGLFAFVLGRLSVNALLFLSIVALGLQMLLGIFVSLHPDRQWVKQRRSGFAVFFAAMGIAGALVAGIQGFGANKESLGIRGQLDAALAKVANLETELERVRADAGKTHAEAVRTKTLNFDLQQKLLEQSSQLKELAVQRVAEVMGADGFAYVDLAAQHDGSGVALQALVNGKHTQRQVRVRLGEGNRQMTPEELGDLEPRAKKLLDTMIQPSRETRNSYKITILAASGPVQEELDVRFNSAKQSWERRMRITRGDAVLLQRDWER